MTALANYSRMPGPGEVPLGYSRRSPGFTSWDGPIYREGRDVPCHVCDATGVIEDGERIDVDDYRDCLCGNCDGTGIEPYHPAGGRYTGPVRHFYYPFGHGDLLEVMAQGRARMLGPLPAENEWRRPSHRANYRKLRDTAMRRTLHTLAQRESDLRVVATYRDMLAGQTRAAA